MLSVDEIADMRDVLEDTMSDVLVVYRWTKTPDSALGFTETWTPLMGGPIPCRALPMAQGVALAQAEQLIAGRIGTDEAWMFTVPVDTAARDTDRILFKDMGYEIVFVLEPRSWELQRRIVAVNLA